MRRIPSVPLALLVSLSGCSVAMVQSPHVSAGKIECTRDFTLPLVDAAAGAAGIITPFILEATRDRNVDDANLLLASALWGAGVVYAISAVVGMTRVKRCRTLEASMANTAPAAAPQP